jgi:hypothetical protein
MMEDGIAYLLLVAETEIEERVFDRISSGTRSLCIKVGKDINGHGKFEGMRPVTVLAAPEIAPCQHEGCKELGMPLAPVTGTVAFEFFCPQHMPEHEGKI